MDQVIKISELRKAFKFQLPVTNSEKFNRYWKEIYFQFDPHHPLGRKTTDYFQVPLSRMDHQKRHEHPDEFFIEDLIKGTIILFDYIKLLEGTMPKKSKERIEIEKQIDELEKENAELIKTFQTSQAKIEANNKFIKKLKSILDPEESSSKK